MPTPVHDAELEDWKRARAKNHRLPWRQISFIASLCFGAASLVLPDDINGNMQGVLYVLAALAFVSGFRKNRV